MKQGLNRWTPLSGVLSVVCSFVGVMLVLNQPQEKDSDATITSYFASHAHRVQNTLGFFVFLAGILLLLVFFSSLRERLRAAEGEPGRLSALVFGAGVVSAPLWVASMLLANGVAFAASESSGFHVDPNTFRVLASTAYFAWVAAVAVSSVVVWGASVVALRTGVLPRWFAIAGIAAGVVQLFGYFLFPFFVWWLWIIVAAALLVRRPVTAAATVPQPAV